MKHIIEDYGESIVCIALGIATILGCAAVLSFVIINL